jgi:hypothetical protein
MSLLFAGLLHLRSSCQWLISPHSTQYELAICSLPRENPINFKILLINSIANDTVFVCFASTITRTSVSERRCPKIFYWGFLQLVLKKTAASPAITDTVAYLASMNFDCKTRVKEGCALRFYYLRNFRSILRFYQLVALPILRSLLPHSGFSTFCAYPPPPQLHSPFLLVCIGMAALRLRPNRCISTLTNCAQRAAYSLAKNYPLSYVLIRSLQVRTNANAPKMPKVIIETENA